MTFGINMAHLVCNALQEILCELCWCNRLAKQRQPREPKRAAAVARQPRRRRGLWTCHAWTCAWVRSPKSGGIQTLTGALTSCAQIATLHGEHDRDHKTPYGEHLIILMQNRIDTLECACSLYVEEVEIGEEAPRQVVSGLVKFIPEVSCVPSRMEARMHVLVQLSLR